MERKREHVTWENTREREREGGRKNSNAKGPPTTIAARSQRSSKLLRSTRERAIDRADIPRARAAEAPAARTLGTLSRPAAAARFSCTPRPFPRPPRRTPRTYHHHRALNRPRGPPPLAPSRSLPLTHTYGAPPTAARDRSVNL